MESWRTDDLVSKMVVRALDVAGIFLSLVSPDELWTSVVFPRRLHLSVAQWKIVFDKFFDLHPSSSRLSHGSTSFASMPS